MNSSLWKAIQILVSIAMPFVLAAVGYLFAHTQIEGHPVMIERLANTQELVKENKTAIQRLDANSGVRHRELKKILERIEEEETPQ